MTNNYPRRHAKKDPTSQEAAITRAKSLFASVWADSPAQYEALRAATGSPEQRRALQQQDSRMGNPTHAAAMADQARIDVLREEADRLESQQLAELDAEVAEADYSEEDTDPAVQAMQSMVEDGKVFQPSADENYNQYMVSQGFTPAGEA